MPSWTGLAAEAQALAEAPKMRRTLLNQRVVVATERDSTGRSGCGRGAPCDGYFHAGAVAWVERGGLSFWFGKATAQAALGFGASPRPLRVCGAMGCGRARFVVRPG